MMLRNLIFILLFALSAFGAEVSRIKNLTRGTLSDDVSIPIDSDAGGLKRATVSDLRTTLQIGVTNGAVATLGVGALSATNTATGGTVSRPLNDRFADFINVKDKGALGVGTDDTAAVQAAYDSLNPTSGGELYFPPGDYKFNLVVTKPNVTIRGSSHIHYNSGAGTMTNRFRPAVNGSPVVQIGNDTGYVKGFKMLDATIEGQSVGSIGALFAGGAFNARLLNVSVTLFTNCVKLQGGTTYPVSLIFLDGVDGQPADVSGARGILVSQTANYPTSYTTAIYLSHSHWDGPASQGYTVEIDSADLTISDSYFDMANNHGFKISKSQTSNPKLHMSSVALDSASGTDVLIETHNTQRIFSDVVSGRFSIDGLWKLSDATTLTPPPAAFAQNVALSYPNVTGSLNLVDSGEADFTGGSYTNHRIYASSSNLFMVTRGTAKLAASTGVFQIDGKAATGDSYLKFQDNVNNKSVLIEGLNGVMYLSPASGGSVRMVTSASANLMRFFDDGNVFFDGIDNRVEIAAPSVSGATTAKIYHDSALHRLMLSQAGSAYSALVTAASTDTFSNKSLTSPRLTPVTKAARNALTPAEGMIVMQSDNTPGLRIYQSGAWVAPNVTADP